METLETRCGKIVLSVYSEIYSIDALIHNNSGWIFFLQKNQRNVFGENVSTEYEEGFCHLVSFMTEPSNNAIKKIQEKE